MNKKELINSIVKFRTSAPDNIAVEEMNFYPDYEIGKAYSVGVRFVYGEKLYKVKQEHTSEAEWTPDATPALYEVINVTHAGTLEDPIPYSGNMALESGKYYEQNGVVYLCTRDTGTAVYNPLADLVNIYVEVV